MRENIYFYFMHIHDLFILSLVILLFNTTTATSHGHQLVAAGGQAVHKCIEKERQALLDFKAPLHDPFDKLSTWRPEEDDSCLWDGVMCDNVIAPLHDQYDMLSAWTPEEEDDCCEWLGVTCNNQTGHVTKLAPILKFTGTIPESIGNMTKLTYLGLTGNNFSGVIPRSIGSLTKLTWLELSDNSFYATIPREFGNLTNLQYLHLNSLVELKT
ncbi:leucine-rich repeat-containing protein [Tanacetum coccineum]